VIRKEVDQLAGGNWRSGLKHRYQVNCRRACALGHICPNTWYRDALRMRIREIAQVRPRFGDVRIWILLRREGDGGRGGMEDEGRKPEEAASRESGFRPSSSAGRLRSQRVPGGSVTGRSPGPVSGVRPPVRSQGYCDRVESTR